MRVNVQSEWCPSGFRGILRSSSSHFTPRRLSYLTSGGSRQFVDFLCIVSLYNARFFNGKRPRILRMSLSFPLLFILVRVAFPCHAFQFARSYYRHCNVLPLRGVTLKKCFRDACLVLVYVIRTTRSFGDHVECDNQIYNDQ